MSMPKFDRVLVAIKSRQDGLPLAAAHARFLAEDLNAEMRLVSCVYDSQVAFGLDRQDATAIGAQAGLMSSCEARLERLGQSLRDWGVAVSTRVVWAPSIHAGVLRAARDWRANLIVIGVHEHGPIPHAYLSETDWQLLRLASCPLLVVKDPSFEGYRRILAAIDPLRGHDEPEGTDRALLAVARAISRASQAELYAVHAFPDPASYAWASSIEVLPGIFYGADQMEDLHRRAVAELVGEYGIRNDRIELRAGQPLEQICAVIDELDIRLVVIGAVRHGRLHHAVLGSTAETIVAEASCDVLLVKPPSP